MKKRRRSTKNKTKLSNSIYPRGNSVEAVKPWNCIAPPKADWALLVELSSGVGRGNTNALAKMEADGWDGLRR